MTKKRHSLTYLDTEDTFKELTKKRSVIRGKLTLFVKYVDSLELLTITEAIRTELQTRLAKADSLLSSFSDIQDEIDANVPESQIEKELSEREVFENQFYAYVAKSKCIINSDRIEKQINNASKGSCAIKLPTISLPSFDGSYDHWLEYRDTYLSLIHHSKDIDNVQKFHYLRSSLTGNALLVIKSLEFSSENYTIAWDLLENRYNNNRLLVQNHVKALFNLSSINKESSAQIRKLIDNILKNLRALNTLGEPTEYWDTLLIYFITTKLDSYTEREWENYKGTISSQDKSGVRLKLDTLLEFLKNRADVLETINMSHSKGNMSDNHSKHYTHIHNKSHSLVSTQEKQSNTYNKSNSKRIRSCTMCESQHPLYACNSFLNLSIKDKIKFVKEKRLCFNCLRTGHTSTECWFGSCKLCNQKHNSLLHADDSSASTSSAVVQTSAKISGNIDTPPVEATNILHSVQSSNSFNINTSHSLLENVLLSTALVEIADKNNTFHTIRALLDNGSQHCFIAQSLCKKLKLPLIQSTVQVTGVGNSVTHSTNSCDINLRSKITNYNTHLRCLVLPQITAQLPPLSSKSQINIPDNVQLADPSFYQQSEIELLIGADKFWDLLNDGLIRLNSGPYLQNTKLGWILSGPIINNKRLHTNQVHCNYSQSLDTQLRQFWELEEIAPVNKLTKEEQICEDLFKQTTYREQSGRFCVRIPLSAKASDTLGDSYILAQNRFFALERKLDRGQPEYKRLYCDFMNEYLSLGHMTRIEKYLPPNYFLPHHGVLREHSTTTKLRVVFDASAKTTSGTSLNDIQFIGPCLHNDVFSILLRFRQHTYVACADIEKMYRQINIHPDQRNLQLILWRENKSDELGVFQLNTVTYGTASAPFLSIRCIKQLASECEDDVIKQIIDEDIFVDDLVTGHDDEHLLLDICNKVSEILKSACFPLRKWMFNSVNVPNNCTKDLTLGENCLTKTLGLGWSHSEDILHFTTRIDMDVSNVTKRVILSIISQVYDPLGLLAPVIIVAKILLQRLWVCKLGWDDPVPTNIQTLWVNFINTFQYLQNIRIPRHVRHPDSKYTDLHIFTDASQDAYGACAYVSTYSDESPVLVRLLCAKSKVAPIKPVTMPRLELCGALIGAKLCQKISQSWRKTFDNVYLWSDSMIAISWIRMSPNMLKPFVQNRVVQINELTGELPWLHVAGKDNPADLLSRGLTLDALQQSDIWWHGPAFLREIRNDFNKRACIQNIEASDLPELKSNTLSLLLKSNSIFSFERFSSWNRMRRAMAYALRFINNLRIKNKSQRFIGPLTSDELSKSVVVLSKIVQQNSLLDVYTALKNNLPIKSKGISSLDVFLDNDGLIRVGGRLNNSETYSYNKKHPILLSSKHVFAQLLFRYEHNRLLHAGPQLLLSTTRDNWWVLKGRDLAKQTVHKCISCTRQRGKTLSVKMGNLPLERVDPGHPFQRCGVDYAGPVFVLNRKGRGAKLDKCYICLFICFTTRAVHLELVTSLSSDAYLLALRRFISRRGKPAQIFSDNGKTFVGALKEFSKSLVKHEQDIKNFTSGESIEFNFIPPYSPHFGGLWEAGVKSCKHHLRRLGTTNLTYEEYFTLLAQIEAILNSRPMYPLSSDPDDLLPLTPAHFLIGRPLVAPAYKDITTASTTYLNRYERVEQMRQNFWNRWTKEYVGELQTRTKWQVTKDSLAPNTLVLIKEDNLPPLKWRLGRIIRTFPGTDGLARVADIKTNDGIIRRNYQKLCPLWKED